MKKEKKKKKKSVGGKRNELNGTGESMADSVSSEGGELREEMMGEGRR